MSTTRARGLSPVRSELDNGTVVIVQETSMTPSVTISAAFQAGSMFDPVDREGLSYLTGRVIDRGTDRRSGSDIAQELDDRGVSLLVSTNRHSLTLSCTCLTDDFDDVFAIVADMARRPTFPEDEIAKRRAEALTILRQREDNPAARAVDAVMELLYTRNHPYGRPSKGTAGGIERISRHEMAAFHARRCRPAALSVAIVGDIAASHAAQRARMELEDWTAEPPARIDIPSVAHGTGRREAAIPMPGKPQTEIAYGFVTIRRLDPRYYAYWMMNNILGQFGLGGRLADNIRERQGMAYYAFSTLDPAHGEAPLMIRAGVDPANVESALAAIETELSSLASQGPTVKEVEESCAYLVGSIPRMFETNLSIAAFLQAVEEYGLGLDFHRRLPELLRAVTIDEIRAAAAEALDPGIAAVGIAGPPTLARQASTGDPSLAASTGRGQRAARDRG
jgi:zinc protease